MEPRTDQYALGILLFEWLTGRLPFVADDPQELMVMHQVQPAPALRSLLPEASPHLERVIARMLRKEPALRYADLHEVEADLALVGTTAESQAQVSAPRVSEQPATINLRKPR
ncbi:MAG: hypothetical protein U0931_14125 [Vulcanimicrobiota bacterium]